jgi:uncharacterized protein DUF669
VPEFNIDFNEVESFAAIPQGEYAVIVEEVEMRESQSSEYPYLNWKLKVTEGEHEGRYVWMMTSLSPKALWRLKESLDNLEVPLDDFNLVVDEDTNFVTNPPLVGLAAIAPVREDEYQGRITNKVDMLLPAGGGTANGAAKKSVVKKGDAPAPTRKKQFK